MNNQFISAVSLSTNEERMAVVFRLINLSSTVLDVCDTTNLTNVLHIYLQCKGFQSIPHMLHTFYITTDISSQTPVILKQQQQHCGSFGSD